MLRNYLAILSAVLLVIALPLTAAADSVALASISFPNNTAVAEENLSISGFGDKDSGYATSTNGARLYASVSGTDLRKLEWSKGEYADIGMQPVMTGGTKNPWGRGAYLEVRTSTVGYENIAFSASIGATKKGPRDYQLQYSLDGVSYKNIAGATYSIAANKTMFPAFENVALPQDAANTATLYIRIAVASNMMVNGTAGLIGGTGGETAVNHITVSGTPIATTTAPTTAATTAPTSAPTTVPSPSTSATNTPTKNTQEAPAQTVSPSSNAAEVTATTTAAAAPSVTQSASTAGKASSATVSPDSSAATVAPTKADTATKESASLSTAAAASNATAATAKPNGSTTTSTTVASVQTGENTSGTAFAGILLLTALGALLLSLRCDRKKQNI